MPLRLNRKQLSDLVEEIEANGGDATDLRRELESLGPDQDSRTRTRKQGSRFNNEEEPTTAERLNNEVGDLYLSGVSDEQLAKIIDMDRNHSKEELQAMCIEAGLSPSGQKKKLAAKLLAHNEEPATAKSGEPIYLGWGI